MSSSAKSAASPSVPAAPTPPSPYLAAHPIRRVAAQLKNSEKKKLKIVFDKDAAYIDCLDYVNKLSKETCKRPVGFAKCEGVCSCLSGLDSSKEDFDQSALGGLARYMVHWAGLSRAMQTDLFRDHLRYAHASSKRKGVWLKRAFLLPQRSPSDIDAEEPMYICRNALCALLDVG